MTLIRRLAERVRRSIRADIYARVFRYVGPHKLRMAIVIGITIYVGKKTTGEVSEFRTHRSLWKI